MKTSEYPLPYTEIPTADVLRVHRVEGYDFTKEFQLPFPIGSDFDSLVTRVADYNATSGLPYYKTEGTGRGGSLAPFAAFRYVGENPCTFTNICVKGNGIFDPFWAGNSSGMLPDQFIRNWKMLHKPSFMPGNQEIVGAAELGNIQLEMDRARKGQAIDLRVRPPIIAYEVDELPIVHQMMTTEDRLRMDVPFSSADGRQSSIGVFARRFPLPYEDIYEYISRAPDMYKSQAADNVMSLLLSHLRFDDDPFIQDVTVAYAEEQYRWNRTEVLRELERETFVWISRGYAYQMRRFKEEWVVHFGISRHNMSPAVEFFDNAYLSIGPEEIGYTNKIDFLQEHRANRHAVIETLHSFILWIYQARHEEHRIAPLAARVKSEFASIVEPSLSNWRWKMRSRWT